MSRFARIDGEPVYSDLKPERCPQFLDERKRTELRRFGSATGNVGFVYALVPKTSLEGAVQERARKIAMHHIDKISPERRAGADLEAETAYVRDALKERDLWEEP